jgi:hypothetical protein
MLSLILSGCSIWYNKVAVEAGEKAEIAKDTKVYIYYKDPETQKTLTGYVNAREGWLIGRKKTGE